MRVPNRLALFILLSLGIVSALCPLRADPYAKSGNIKPSIVELSAEEEAKVACRRESARRV